MRKYRSVILAIWAVPLLLTCAETLPKARAAENRSRTWVATISVQDYPHLPEKYRLRFCENDAQAFLKRIRAGNRIYGDQVLELNNSALSQDQLPTKANIVRLLPEFLSRAEKDDTVLLFMSMHGMQRRESGRLRTYLLPDDAHPDRFADSAITIEWLREQLQRSTRARTVVLFLDACHSGGIDGVGSVAQFAPLSTRNVEAVFQDSPLEDERRSIYVLSACGSDESSIESSELQHGVFTHWLVCGLDGAADSDGNAVVTMDELFQFVRQQVPRTAHNLARRTGKDFRQTPQRILCGNDHRDVSLMSLRPHNVSTSLTRLSELMDQLLANYLPHTSSGQTAPRVAISEFSVIGQEGRLELRGSLGSFGAISRELVERHLIDAASLHATEAGAYQIVPVEAYREDLREVNLATLRSGDLAGASSRVDALIVGAYTRRGNSVHDPGPDRLQLEIQLLDMKQNSKIGRVSTTIVVDEELWTLLGTSRDEQQTAQEETMIAQVGFSAAPTIPISTIDKWNESRLRPHPQRDPENSTVAIEILQNLPGETPERTEWLPFDPRHPNQLGFETELGHELHINLRNQTDDWLAIIVQIDGLNQIGRKPAPPSQSAYWLCRPGSTLRVDQWLDEPRLSDHREGGAQRQTLGGHRLLVTSPPSSLAGQQQLFDQLGEIRVLVYRARMSAPSGRRGSGSSSAMLGVGEGAPMTNEFPVIRDRVIDLNANLATYVIRYRGKSEL